VISASTVAPIRLWPLKRVRLVSDGPLALGRLGSIHGSKGGSEKGCSMRYFADAIVVLGCGVFLAAPAWSAEPPKPKPTVERYNDAEDDFVYRHSAATAGLPSPDKVRFYAGSTLNRFVFRGPKGRGGIYDALEHYYNERKLDPKKYERH
jgi:hypothetical protein